MINNRYFTSLGVSGFVMFVLIGAAFLLLGGSPVAAVADPAYERTQSATATPWTLPDPVWRILIDRDGLYELTYDDLNAAGLPVDTLNPHTLRMFYMGEPLPIQVTGEADGRFDPTDVVLFYGRSIDNLYYDGLLPTNRYTGANTYWLSYGNGPGERMAIKSSSNNGVPVAVFSQRVHLEQNTRYLSAFPFVEGADHWYWEWIRAQGLNSASSRQHTFVAQDLASGAYTATLSALLLGYSDGPHHLRLYINDVVVFDDALPWSDYNLLTATASFTSSLLVEGDNTIKVEIFNEGSKAYDEVEVNWLSVTYPRQLQAAGDVLTLVAPAAGPQAFQVGNFNTDAIEVYDVSNYRQPQRVVGASIAGAGPYTVTFGDNASAGSRYLAVAPGGRLSPLSITRRVPKTSYYTTDDLLRTTNRADYILITHYDFWPEAERLIAHRARDYHVMLVDVQDIYDQFNGGVMSAESIRDFLAYAYQNWQAPPPTFVALMGDGSQDMRHYGITNNTYIPPYLALVDPTLGETASDNHFVTLVGDDPVPDISIGRLPVNNLDEARVLVNKIINYERNCACGNWSYNTIFLSDNLEGGGGNFYAFSDRVADDYADPPTNTLKYVPPSYNVDKLYLDINCDAGNPDVTQNCTYQLTNTLNITGALFVSYVGHATKTYWAREHLWDATDVTTLNNGPCLPIILGMTCFEGFFQDPSQQALSEFEVRYPEHGAIASWSSTGFGLATGHDVLERGLMMALFHENINQLGPATTYAKAYLWQETGEQYRDLLETYTLLGDPALKVKTDAVCQETPTAVAIDQARAVAGPGAVRLVWRTVDENALVAFNILRRVAGKNAPFATINPTPIFARGGVLTDNRYRFDDRHVESGAQYEYRLQLLQTDGRSSLISLGIAGPLPVGASDTPQF